MILFLVLVIPLTASTLFDDESQYITEDSVHGFNYVYAVGVGDADDDAEEGCNANSGELKFGILDNKKDWSGLYVSYPEKELWEISGNSLTQTGPLGNCAWHNLPLHKKGCYFFSSENDVGPDNIVGVDQSDDCNGWFIPPEKIIPPGYIPSAKKQLFGDDSADTESPDSAKSNGFIAIFTKDEIEIKYRVSGQMSTAYTEYNEQCLFNEYPFENPGRAFLCADTGTEFRWYICDQEHLYETTGKYIPIPQCLKNSDCEASEGDGSTCTAGSCFNPQEQPIKPEKREGRRCIQDYEGTYTWETFDLNCKEGGIDCDDDEIICTTDLGGGGYSWLPDAPDGEKCCGDDGLEDFTMTYDSEQFSGEHMCLNKNMVGGEIPAEAWTCEGEWCWVNAQNAKFKILTIKKPLEQPYDLLSNGQWHNCSKTEEEGTQGISSSSSVFEPSDIKKANRFYCYQEGNRWSWADCPSETGADLQNGVKGRAKGDGLFALPVKKSDTGNSRSVDFSGYTTFYGNKARFDLAGYDYLEFYVQFTGEDKLVVPAELKLTIQGPKQGNSYITYYEENVLSYADNNPLLEKGRFIHIKVPLPSDGFLGVSGIKFDSVENPIEIRNVFLSNEGPDNPLCSGENSDQSGQTAWFTNLDFYGSRNYKAKDLCNELYSQPAGAGNAWLGNDVEAERRCCGNSKNEYFASGEKGLGCWNSQPIAHRGKTMNVEVKVGYEESSIKITYPKAMFSWSTTKTTPLLEKVVDDTTLYCPNVFCDQDGYHEGGNVLPAYENCQILEDGCSGRKNSDTTSCQVKFTHAGQEYTTFQNCNLFFAGTKPVLIGSVSQLSVPEDINRTYAIGIDAYIFHETKEYDGDTKEISFSGSPLLIKPLSTNKADFEFNGKAYGGLTIEHPLGEPYNNDLVDLSLLNPATGEESSSIDASTLPSGTSTVYAIAKVNDNYKIEITPGESVPTYLPLNYVCNQECLFPLPGTPPPPLLVACAVGQSCPPPQTPPLFYTLTNPRPDLYELYFVKGPKPEDKILITQPGQQFSVPGNLLAKKVAQQVLFVNTLDDVEAEKLEAKFYGCQAASFLQTPPNLPIGVNYEVVDYCQYKTKEDFCSPSVSHAGTTADQKGFTTINSWTDSKDSPFDEVGYETIDVPQLLTDPTAFYNSIQLQLRPTNDLTDESQLQRNQYSPILPARNFISNAEFSTSGQELPHWEILDGNGIVLTNENNQVSEKTVTLLPGQKLRSERIAVPQQADLSFSQSETCNVNIILVDKDGNKVTIQDDDLSNFNTGDASYALLEFTGSCIVNQPLLQRLDELGAATYQQAQRNLIAEELDDINARSGLACCPESYCWNGYACVEPMSSYTYLAEHVADGRDYRCLGGQWTYLPPQRDWNNQQWGFCSNKEECFVMSSTAGASPDYTARQFYGEENGEKVANKYPTCIKDKEYIFDHYCQQGNWSSRTKFVATKLLERAGDENYVLYCTNYREALLNFNNPGDVENRLGGEGTATGTPTGGGEALAGQQQQPQQIRTCFDLDTDIVDDKENTCINNVCILKDSTGKVSFATSLNRNGTDPKTDPNSFLIALNIPQDKLDEVCVGEGEFIECDLSGLDIDGDLWYSPGLNAVFYGRQGLSLEPGIIDKIVGWFKGLLGIQSELSDEQQFVQQAQNFRELYLLNGAGKKVRALQEIFPGKKMLVAEYENFDTPLCDYVQNLQLPTAAQTEPLEQAAGTGGKVACSQEGNVQRVEALEALDFFWPQLTGRLRVG